jgi:hypothetical protein
MLVIRIDSGVGGIAYFIDFKEFLGDEEVALLDHASAYFDRRWEDCQYENRRQEVILYFLGGYQALTASISNIEPAKAEHAMYNPTAFHPREVDKLKAGHERVVQTCFSHLGRYTPGYQGALSVLVV